MDVEDKLLIDSIKLTGKNQLFIGILFTGSIAVVLYIFLMLLGKAGDDTTRMILFGIVAFLSLFGLAGIFRIIRGVQFLNAKETEIYKIVNSNPEKIVWIYKQITTRIVFYIIIPVFISRVPSIIVGLDNKKRVQLSASKKTADQLLVYIHSKSPKARTGYAANYMRAFLKNPKSLVVQ